MKWTVISLVLSIPLLVSQPKTLTPDCTLVNSVKTAGGASGNIVQKILDEAVGLAQATTYVALVIAALAFIFLVMTKHRSKGVTALVVTVLVVFGFSTVIGFSTSINTGGCSFFS